MFSATSSFLADFLSTVSSILQNKDQDEKLTAVLKEAKRSVEFGGAAGVWRNQK